MSKSWILLGDAAFDDKEVEPLGVLKFKSKELANWREIALNKIKTAIEECPKEREIISESNCIVTGGCLYKGVCTDKSEFEGFTQELGDYLKMEHSVIEEFNNLDSKRGNGVIVFFCDWDDYMEYKRNSMKKIKNKRKKIKVQVYDMELEVTINTQETKLYRKAAQYATDRYHAYHVHYRDKKTDFEIGLLTMLDIVVAQLKRTEGSQEDEDSPQIEICLEVVDYSIHATIPQTSEKFFMSAAKTVSQRYSDYYDHYKDEKDEYTIMLMTLLDLTLGSIN